jgi:GAF domain-containing protein
MTDRIPAQAVTELLAELVREHETTDVFSRLVQECRDHLAADAVAVLVTTAHHGLELLSATSHRVAELELYQAQQLVGPCVDVVRTAEPLSSVGADEIAGRWPEVGKAIVDAGFLAVHALPMTWHGRPLGGLNVFGTSPDPLPPSSLTVAQNFANIASLALVQPDELSQVELDERVDEAMNGRIIIEQAKGVLAQTLGLDMAEAYDLLAQRAVRDGWTLTETARGVIHDAQRQ